MGYTTPKSKLRIAIGETDEDYSMLDGVYRARKVLVTPNVIPFHQDLKDPCEGQRIATAEGPFYAVLQFKTWHGFRKSGGLYTTWEPKTPVFGAVTEVPMVDWAFFECVKNMEWVGVGLLDGKWEWRKSGQNLTVWPLFE